RSARRRHPRACSRGSRWPGEWAASARRRSGSLSTAWTPSGTCSSSREPFPVRRTRSSRSERTGRTMATSVKAPVLDGAGKKAKDLTLEAAVFGAEVKPHLVHETVRAELNADRAGTRGSKSRGLVSGGRSKPWRQKGTGRARAGTTRAPHWTGGGVAFAPTPRDYEVKVNRKARRSALRSVLSQHAADGTFGVLDGSGFSEPSTRKAADLLAQWGKELPL